MAWDGQAVLRTATVKNSLEPEWVGERCVLRLHRDGHADSEGLVVEVYDADMLARGDFLGRLQARAPLVWACVFV